MFERIFYKLKMFQKYILNSTYCYRGTNTWIKLRQTKVIILDILKYNIKHSFEQNLKYTGNIMGVKKFIPSLI